MADEYPQLTKYPAASGKKVWRAEVYGGPSRALTADERRHGPRCTVPDGIYIVTVSEETPPELFELGHLLNLASKNKRSTLAHGFVPTDNYDSAIAVANGRVVGGVSVDVGRRAPITRELTAAGRTKKCKQGATHFGPVVMFLWVHPAHRRKGLGRQLLEATASHFGCSVEKLGYWLPITRKAVRLLWSMGIRKIQGFG